MRRPPPAVYLVGNPVSAFAILGFSGLLTYEWWVGAMANGWLPVIAAIFSATTLKANEKLTAYARFKRAWDAMEGKPPPRRGRWRKVVAVVLWLTLALWFAGLNYHHQPAHVVALVSFIAASVLMLGRVCSRKSRTPRQKPDKLVVVTVMQAVPRRSPSVAEAASRLPAYCCLAMSTTGAGRGA